MTLPPQQTVLNAFADAATILGDGSPSNPMRVNPDALGGGGAVGQVSVPAPTGASDDALISAKAAEASAAGKGLAFQAGRYVLSEAATLSGLVGAVISGTGDTVIEYRSDDTTLTPAQRNGFNLVNGCVDVTITGIKFVGGTHPQVTTVNTGVGVRADQTCRGIRLGFCTGEDGAQLYNQDQTLGVSSGSMLIGCIMRRCRAPFIPASGTDVVSCFWEQAGANAWDIVGMGDRFTVEGTAVTLRDEQAAFDSSLLGLQLVTLDATTPANNGQWTITAVPSARELRFENPAGVAETFRGSYHVPRGDTLVTRGAGSGAITTGPGTWATVTVVHPVSTAMIGSIVRIAYPTSAGNAGRFLCVGIAGPFALQIVNPAAVAESFFGVVTVDGYDNVTDSGNTWGSTHGAYCFGGRERVKFIGCTFENIRGYAVKASATSAPIRSITMTGNTFVRCGGVAIWGADDSQEHVNISLRGSTIVDCATGRPGWNEGVLIGVYGSRGSVVADNQVEDTQNAVDSLTGTRSVAQLVGIQALRYVDGASQPLVDLDVHGNTFTARPGSTRPGQLRGTPITIADVGITAKWGPATLSAAVGGVVTLTDPNARFSTQDVNSLIAIVFDADAANNVTNAVVRSVINASSLTFDNPAGVVSAGGGTYRIVAQPNDARGGVCQVYRNASDGASSGYLLTVTSCVGPDIADNTWSRGAGVYLAGNVSPRVTGSREVTPSTNAARIVIAEGNSFPYLDDNVPTNPALGSGNDGAHVTNRGGIGIATTSGGAKVDYPLQGKRGKVKATGGRGQMLIAYGSKHVDGDKINMWGNVLTYKSNAPNGVQFNSWAMFVARLNAMSGITCIDYGHLFTPAVDTYHALVYIDSASAAVDEGYVYEIRTLNPTALVVLRNDVAGGEAMQYSRGELHAVDGAVRTVVWSPYAALDRAARLEPVNTAARTLLAAGGYMREWDAVRTPKDDGVCEVILHNANPAGDAEFRWSY